MSDYNKTMYPVPDRSNATKMKEFMKLKYEQKRFMDGDPNDSEEETKPKKTKKKKKRAPSSSEEEDKSEDSESEEE